MKSLLTLILVGLCAVVGNAAASGPISLNPSSSWVLPVLVQVNTKGKVTHVSAAFELTPYYDKLLRKNISELITGPAILRKQPVSSQLVINMALHTTPRDEGGYYAQFAYVSSSPLPSEPLHWVHVDGHRLVLAGNNFRLQTGPRYWNNGPHAYPQSGAQPQQSFRATQSNAPQPQARAPAPGGH